MRQQLTFELQQTQRTLGFIDPNDKQLTASLQEQQAELTNQLKEINAQLKIQGIPAESQEPSVNNSFTPKVIDIVTGSAPPPPIDSNPLIQRRENLGTKPTTPNTGTELTVPKEIPSPIPPFQPPFQPIPGIGITPPINNLAGTANPLPTPFDQDQAWADSPWVPKPSKELSELKQTVDSLRKEINDLKENIKALETQIQLLNRNILLSQPK
jgi:restriction endonuclease S subunit